MDANLWKKKKKKKRGKRNCVWTENFRKAGPSSAFGPHSTSATSLSLTAARSSCFFFQRDLILVVQKRGGGKQGKMKKLLNARETLASLPG